MVSRKINSEAGTFKENFEQRLFGVIKWYLQCNSIFKDTASICRLALV